MHDAGHDTGILLLPVCFYASDCQNPATARELTLKGKNNIMETQMTKTKWVLDPAHSELLFSVRHLMISNVRGEFRNFSVEVDGEDFRNDPVLVKIQTGSVFTNDENRDNHLRAADFFDAENHPEMIFESTSVTKTGDNEFRLSGNLTMKGVTRGLDLDLTFNGSNKDPWGNEKAGFSLSGKLNRSDWGLIWNAALETGGVLVSDTVKLNAEIQLVRQS